MLIKQWLLFRKALKRSIQQNANIQQSERQIKALNNLFFAPIHPKEDQTILLNINNQPNDPVLASRVQKMGIVFCI